MINQKEISRVVAIAGLKGGIGKSTIAINLSLEYKRNNHDVSVLDLDYLNSTSHDFFEDRDIECIIPVSVDDMADYIKIGKTLIADLGGYDSVENRAILSIADVVIIPSKSGAIEENSLVKFITLLNEIEDITDNTKKIIVVPTMTHHKKDRVSIENDYKGLKELSIQIAEPISNSANFVKASNKKQSVYEYGATKQALQINKLYNLIQE